MKNWYKSKTIIFNLLAIITMLLQGIGAIKPIPHITPEDQAGIIASINLLFRTVTDSGIKNIFKKNV